MPREALDGKGSHFDANMNFTGSDLRKPYGPRRFELAAVAEKMGIDPNQTRDQLAEAIAADPKTKKAAEKEAKKAAKK